MLPMYMHTSNSLGGDVFTRENIIWVWHWDQVHTYCCPVPSTSCDIMFVVGVKATQNVDQYSLHHVTYAHAKFEVVASKFRRRCIYKKTYENCCPVPSTSCDMCTCKVWRLRWRCIYKKIPNLTFDLDLEVNVTQNVAQNPLRHVI